MNYIGITVGPIIETMMRTSSPAGLWLSSYLFSIIIRDLCIELQEKEYDIFSLPKRYVVKEHLGEHEGVGRYNDRMYGCKDIEPIEIEQDIIHASNTVLKKLAHELACCKVDNRGESEIYEELRSYIHIHYVIATGDNVRKNGITSSLIEVLDSLELSRNVISYPEELYLHKVLEGTRAQGSNIYLKHFPPLLEASACDSFLIADKVGDGLEVHNLEYLSTLGQLNIDDKDTPKIQRYFAIVQCDGDNMGTLFATPKTIEEMKNRQRSVTKQNLAFGDKAIEEITRFGGFTIFAGGDDLLFIAPIIGKNGKTILELCRDISQHYTRYLDERAIRRVESSKAGKIAGNDTVEEMYKVQSSDTALSIGVSINYYKYPLYEAMADARSLLFDSAKRFTDRRLKKTQKNNIALKLRKASGGQAGIICCMNSTKSDAENAVFDDFIQLIKKYFLPCKGHNEDKDRVMHSILYHFESIKGLFVTAIEPGADVSDESKYFLAEQVLGNYFDNANQAFGANFLKDIAKIAVDTAEDYKCGLIKGLGSNKAGNDNALHAVTSMLRIAKFLVERRA